MTKLSQEFLGANNMRSDKEAALARMYDYSKEQMKRAERALEVLKDGNSDYTWEHIERIDYLKVWLVDAMLEYADEYVKQKTKKTLRELKKINDLTELRKAVSRKLANI